MAKKQKRTKKRHVVIFAFLLLILFLILLLYTLLTAQPKDLKMGVVSLDEGYTTSQGSNNLGAQMVQNLISGELLQTAGGAKEMDLNSYAIEFKSYDSEEALNQAIQSEEVAGAIVIPEDYTKNKIEETTTNITTGIADTANAAVNVIIEKTSDPAVTQALGAGITNMLSYSGIDSNASYADGDPEGEPDPHAADPFLHIWLLLPPILSSIALSRIYPIRRGDGFGGRVRRLGVGVLLSALISLVIAAGDYFILTYAYHYTGSVPPSIAHLWMMSFLVMMFFGALAQISAWLAGIVAALLILFGAISGYVFGSSCPFVMIPWLIETFTDITLDMADTLLPGMNLWSSGEQALLGYAIFGIALNLAIAAFDRRKDPSYSYTGDTMPLD